MELYYSRVTEDRKAIILEDREGNELGRYSNAEQLHTAAKNRSGACMIIPREEEERSS
ncbi:hypothetical protein [Amycolatopsis sp. NPDC003731]